MHVGKAALHRVDLVRRNAEVENCPVKRADIETVKNCVEFAEISAHNLNTASQAAQPFACRQNRIVILINADKQALSREPFADSPRMTAAADCPVKIGAVGRNVQRSQNFVEHNAFVRKVQRLTASKSFVPYIRAVIKISFKVT